MPDLHRVPSVQDCVSYGRLGTCARASAGTRHGTSGQTSGNAPLTWACAAAAVLLLRHHPPGPPYLARLEHQHGKGKARTILAPQLARATS
jgi:hypothetical protein